VVGGVLAEISSERVNVVNIKVVTDRRGLSVVEQKDAAIENYSSLIDVEVITNKGTISAAGTMMRNQPHIVRVNEHWMDFIPEEGYFLFADHLDRPGLIGAVGKVTGDADINISHMLVSRTKPRGQAMMILRLDEPIPEDARQKLLSFPDVYSIKQVKL